MLMVWENLASESHTNQCYYPVESNPPGRTFPLVPTTRGFCHAGYNYTTPLPSLATRLPPNTRKYLQTEKPQSSWGFLHQLGLDTALRAYPTGELRNSCGCRSGENPPTRKRQLTNPTFGGKILSVMPKWRNRQTRCVQGAVGISPCGFKSHLRHHPPSQVSIGLGFVFCRLPAAFDFTIKMRYHYCERSEG